MELANGERISKPKEESYASALQKMTNEGQLPLVVNSARLIQSSYGCKVQDNNEWSSTSSSEWTETESDYESNKNVSIYSNDMDYRTAESKLDGYETMRPAKFSSDIQVVRDWDHVQQLQARSDKTLRKARIVQQVKAEREDRGAAFKAKKRTLALTRERKRSTGP